jgi:hypothetical protein
MSALGEAPVRNERTKRVDASEAAPAPAMVDTRAALAYRKPTLRRLGVWNMFTRNNSITGDQPYRMDFRF